MIALVLLTVGILGLARVLPQSSRSEVAARMESTGSQYGNEVIETLRGLPRTNSAVSAGRHPASGWDSLGTTKAWRRCYVVSQMASPLDSLLKVDATVLWKSTKAESLHIIGYLLP